MSAPARKRHVVAQYDATSAAQDYSLGYARQCVDGRLLQARLECVLNVLAEAPSGRLLDAGCGPGVLVHSVLRSPRHDFAVTVLDQSPAMIAHCVLNAPSGHKGLDAYVGDLAALPFADGSFDIALVTGALEYTDIPAAVSELSRVTRPGGMVVASMLNPLSPYRLVQWGLFWPALRLLSVVERALGIRNGRRHGAVVTGIRAARPAKLRALMGRVGLSRAKVTYLSPTVLIPPLDKLPWVSRAADKVSGALLPLGLAPLLATGYLVVAWRD